MQENNLKDKNIFKVYFSFESLRKILGGHVWKLDKFFSYNHMEKDYFIDANCQAIKSGF